MDTIGMDGRITETDEAMNNDDVEEEEDRSWCIRLKRARKAKKLTQQQLGDLIGRSQSTVQSWEREKRTKPSDKLATPSLALWTALATELEVPIAWLPFGVGEAHDRTEIEERIAETMATALAEHSIVIAPTRAACLYLAAHDIVFGVGAIPDNIKPEVARRIVKQRRRSGSG